MLKNYLKIALRNLRRQKGYAFINVAGLSIGLACSFFILIWVLSEVSYDRFFKDGDQLYRVWRNVNVGGQIHSWYSTPKPLAETMKAEFPEITQAVNTFWPQKVVVTRESQSFREAGNYADAAFFELFSFPFIQGNPATALQGESAVVITGRTARKLFGEGWQQTGKVLGQRLTIDHRKDFTITGVIEDLPANSTIQFDVLLPIQDFYARNPWAEEWGSNSFPLYVKLKQDASLEAVNAKIADVINRHEEDEDEVVFLQPFEDIHLYTGFKDGKQAGGRIEYVRIFSAVAVFLLLIACINFMNLATARSTQRAREIGVRKAIGAQKKALVWQFMTEALLMACVALAVATLLVHMLLPAFNDLTGKHIGVADLDGRFLLAVLGITLLVGVFSGSYPALYLSSFNPVAVLRGTFGQRPGTATLRKGLVVFQFALSVLLIVATIAVYLQLHYIRTLDLGLDRANLVFLTLEGAAKDQYEAFKQELLKRPGIVSVTSSDMNPLQIGHNTTSLTWEGKDPGDDRLFYIINANYDFAETMKMELAGGRTFSKAYGADTTNYLINEETAKAIGGSDVIGKTLELWDRKGQVIGVVKNFSMNSLYGPIEPTIIRLDPQNTWMLFVRTAPGRTREALAGLEAVYAQFNAGYPFDYTFLDQDFEQTYKSEAIMGTLANLFAVIAVFISCLGLFGLTSFTVEQRTKEIGVRKVLGASVPHLVRLLTTNFTLLVLAGIVIAIPVAYYAVHGWLADFVYRIELSWWIFALAGLLALVIALLTVSYQAVKAALADPVQSLRYE